MPYSEYENWRAFYVMYPFDDRHRYYRPAALIASVNAMQPNSALKAALDWLQPNPATMHLNETDKRTLAALGLNS